MRPFVLVFVLFLGVASAEAKDRDFVRVRLGASISGRIVQSRSLRLVEGRVIPNLRPFANVSGDSQWRLRESAKDHGFDLEVRTGRQLWARHRIQGFPVLLEVGNGRMDGKKLPPKIWIEMAGGVLQFRADIPFQDYLLGVLNREMPGRWPLEALKAQAVATRSYTRSQMSARQAQSFDVEGSILDQEFEWIPPESRGSFVLRRWEQALHATEDEVLLNHEGVILRAFYHADCGGRTTTPDFVWGPSGDYKSVRDPSCEKSTRHRWKFVAAKEWIQNQLSGWSSTSVQARGALELSWIQSLFDQRVTLVEWWDGASQIKMLSGQNFRKLLGFGKLKSLRFSTRDLGQKIEFSGQGSGHGVGLCQWGTKDWAEKGRTYRQILSHYYPLARLQKDQVSLLATTSEPKDQGQISRF